MFFSWATFDTAATTFPLASVYGDITAVDDGVGNGGFNYPIATIAAF